MPKCPICGKIKSSKQDLIDHIDDIHSSDIPMDMTPAQFIYKSFHDGRSYGLCRICGKPTQWNEKTGKPYQLCGSQSCKDRNRKVAEARMMKVYGKTNLLNDAEQQKKMLANRHISGTYNWSDGRHKFTYTGSFEKFAIEWLDKVMDLNPDTIHMPGPTIPYEIGGERKLWITDMYIEDFNLIVEIKDGSFEKNTHPGFAHNRELEEAKDLSMKEQNNYNYVKVTNKDMLELVKAMNQIRLNNIYESDKKPSAVVMINESVDEMPDTKETQIITEFNRIKDCIGLTILSCLPNNDAESYKVACEFDDNGVDDKLASIGYSKNLNGYVNDNGYALSFENLSDNVKKAILTTTEPIINALAGLDLASVATCNCIINTANMPEEERQAALQEHMMSIANLSPIMTNRAGIIEIAPYQMENKLGIPNVAISSPTDSNDGVIVTKVESPVKVDGIINGEDDTESSNIYSNNEKDQWDPLVVSNNFTSTENIEMDDVNKISDDILKSTVQSN